MISGGETTSERPRNLMFVGRTSLKSDLTNMSTADHVVCSFLYIFNTRTLSSDTDLHALLATTDHIIFHMIERKETKSKEIDMRSLNYESVLVRVEMVPS
ncbi:unnamed protein product [Angiostrongylus costaricensis]|uniref:Uncharacterized protein n=1 Tax=Angiostrongylus costaricensis TaxID=334426 RepID=A0A0R3PBB7_ANGCS|nr:unnamed protein product [Angiostrongylus costaricensis]